MLPTPSTSHVDFDRIYEPAEDSYLLLDTISSEGEKSFLQHRFRTTPQLDGTACPTPSPVIAEIGTGSGVVLAFVNAYAEIIFGRSDILTIGVDVNKHACQATELTVSKAAEDQTQQNQSHGHYVGNIVCDLSTAVRPGLVDVIIFNPPYVPTSELPDLPVTVNSGFTSYQEDSHLLSLSYAGGADGMETTNRLLDGLAETLSNRGVAYVLLCAQNKPNVVKARLREHWHNWSAETVGSSGNKAGWEKLQILRICRIATYE